ncbi:hypothetical protein TNCV_3499601 [Trichonephila clavipes]|nr:hypothetical protein TNCV_3499601 [Trichonephila clavipes]
MSDARFISMQLQQAAMMIVYDTTPDSCRVKGRHPKSQYDRNSVPDKCLEIVKGSRTHGRGCRVWGFKPSATEEPPSNGADAR